MSESKENLISVNPDTFLQRPWRSPIEVPELLVNYYKDKKVIDVGCGAGDFIPIWAKYAKEVIGYECNVNRYEILANREDLKKLNNVTLLKTLADPKVNMPEADFYYVWLNDKNERDKIKEGLIELGVKGIFAYYGGWSTRDLVDLEKAKDTPTANGMYELTDEEYEDMVTEVIYFHSKELDNRPHYDELSKTNKFRLIVEQL